MAEDRFLRLPEVLSRVAMGKTKVYAMIGEGRFPAPKKLGHRTAVWSASQVDGWMRDQMAA
jgi:prophage regulatory protein